MLVNDHQRLRSAVLELRTHPVWCKPVFHHWDERSTGEHRLLWKVQGRGVITFGSALPTPALYPKHGCRWVSGFRLLSGLADILAVMRDHVGFKPDRTAVVDCEESRVI